MKLDPKARYTKTHEWVRVEGNEAICGITDYAQEQLSDIVYVELPEVGDTFAQGDEFAVIESVKTAADCYMPLSGEITAINEALADSPELVNKDPYGEGWLVRFRPSDLSEMNSLMDAEAYEKFVAEEEAKE
ncbi:MAG: glycine cleavage system protein GcvH [Chloroflexi bacterium]|nr:MAG: glycine cleavage system protein GcvH [Chloroflexota bacterium]HDN79568.1 glycine cleavage system protein GcvH [Chloroflexota bacterium]